MKKDANSKFNIVYKFYKLNWLIDFLILLKADESGIR